jgi:hypothetical protein
MTAIGVNGPAEMRRLFRRDYFVWVSSFSGYFFSAL